MEINMGGALTWLRELGELLKVVTALIRPRDWMKAKRPAKIKPRKRRHR